MKQTKLKERKIENYFERKMFIKVHEFALITNTMILIH